MAAAKKDADKLADAVEEEAKPAAKIDTSPSGAGRPNDIPIRKPESAPLGGNSTFASRVKSANKKVDPSQTTSK